jgi:hypothetical protein
LEGIDSDKTAIELALCAEEMLQGLAGNILATRQRDVRMPWPQVRFEACRKSSIAYSLVQLKEMRMSAPDPEPDDVGARFPRKCSDLAQREKEGRVADRGEVIAQFLLRFGPDVAEESEGEMNLLGRNPTDSRQARIQPGENSRDRRGQFQTNEKALRLHRPGSSFVVARDRRVTDAT